ncbi:MAG: glycosyltransferase, partial [Bacteroidales bacterium]|nr:glycosyltransferase [Bacteroidales bacterium]
VPYKGFEYLVQAARNLPDDYIVLIGGKGPLDSKLRGMISAAGLEDKVKLLGFMAKEDVPGYFGACDVFVLSSVMKTEAFGIVQIEAMSCGKPVIATRIPESGVSWVNEHGYSGLNVGIMDPEALSDAITSVCSDNKIHEKFSNNAINHYLSVFTEKGMISNFLNLYEERTKTNDCSVADNACILRNPGEDRVS